MGGKATEDLASAWRQLLARRDQLKEDRTLAELALGLIREMGNTREHRAVLKDLCEAWAHDWRLLLATASLLIEQAGRRGMDEPRLQDEGPAHWAAAGLEQALQELDPGERSDPEIAGNLHASLGNALRACGPDRDADARAAFERATDLDPERGRWWYDAGLLHKWRGRFREGLAANENARRQLGDERPVLWNLAICATATGDAEDAVEAWRQLGIDARVHGSPGMPYVAGLPPLLVRVLSRTPATNATSQLPDNAVGFELVWVAPLSPCHGVVQSPTFRDAPIDYGDLVLWDGAPVASHQASDGEVLPVFPLLEVLRQGDERRFAFVAFEREAGALNGLEDELPDGVRVFIQRERVETHCAACAAGVPHEHDSSTAEPNAIEGLQRGKLVVPASQDLTELREAWEGALGSRAASAALPSLYEDLGDTKRAGQEHQAWRGIEGKALRGRSRP